MTVSSVLPDTEVTAYERELAAHLGVAHVMAVSSGTAALPPPGPTYSSPTTPRPKPG
jgi:hypothetical protein